MKGRWVVLMVASALAAGAIAGGAWAGMAKGGAYLDLLERADGLWSEYTLADQAYFDHEKVTLEDHVVKLAAIQERLAELHAEWMRTEAPGQLKVVDLKVGLALELQMAAIGAEIVGLLDSDSSYIELSSTLDGGYEAVVDDLE